MKEATMANINMFPVRLPMYIPTKLNGHDNKCICMVMKIFTDTYCIRYNTASVFL